MDRIDICTEKQTVLAYVYRVSKCQVSRHMDGPRKNKFLEKRE